MIQAFLNDIKSKAVFVKNVSPKFEYPRDPKDEKYINLAIEAEADYLISRDKDLLDLMTDVSIAGKEFRQKSRPYKNRRAAEVFADFRRKRITVESIKIYERNAADQNRNRRGSGV